LKKWSLLFVLVVFFFSGFGANVKAATFSDLQSSHRFYEEMLFLEAEGIITGYPDGTFRPDGEVTRAAAAIMIGRALELNGQQRATVFSDVGADQKASGYIASAVNAGIIQGYPDGTYRPNETVTRGQMAIFLSRAFNLTEEAATPFKDISPSMASYLHIKRIVEEKLTQGYEDHTFRPNVKVTRAQFSAFLARALNDEFKVEIPVVYLKDPNKTYYYYSKDIGHYYYYYPGEEYPDWNLWYVYEEDGDSYAVVESQDSRGYGFGYPYSEITFVITNPIEVGHSWDIEYGYQILSSYEITATNMTVTTPAGTFENVIEVTEKDGWVGYYAPNVGIIKETVDGETIVALTKIENR
jgi:hypothetical protein